MSWNDSEYIMISFGIGMLLAMFAGGMDGADSSLSTLIWTSLASIAFMIRGVYVMNKNGQLQ